MANNVHAGRIASQARPSDRTESANLGDRLIGGASGLASALAAGFILLAPVIPTAAGALTLILYIAVDESASSIFLYTAAAVLVGAAVGSLLLGLLGTIDRANRTSYDQFLPRYEALRRRLKMIPVDGRSAVGYVDASAYLDAIEKQMPSRSTRWVLGVGYINLWTNLHRAEEALLSVEYPNEALSQAHHDMLRLRGSKIPGKEKLLSDLKDATETLHETNYSRVMEDLASDNAETRDRAGKLRLKVDTARMTAAEVRKTVNEYRDSRFDALVRARNALNARTFVAGLVAYTLLAVVVLEDVGTSEAVAAAVFCLVGAIAGFFNRLYADQRTERTVEDYGLSTARLFRTALFSSLAGVGGVVVVAMIPASLNDLALSDDTANAVAVASPAADTQQTALVDEPVTTDQGQSANTTSPSSTTSDPAAPAAQVQPPVSEFPSLASIFDLGANPFRIVLAAIFGLTPELLLLVVRQQGERLKAQLKSTEPGEGQADTEEE